MTRILTAVSPVHGSLSSVAVAAGDAVTQGQTLAIIESMKMEHVVTAPVTGRVKQLRARRGDVVKQGELLAEIEASTDTVELEVIATATNLEVIRPDLHEARARHAFLEDANRPDAVAKRARLGMRTARANVNDLLDPGSFSEYGALAIAAQRSRRKLDDLICNTPADGLITGIGTVNAAQFGAERTRCAVMAYDYTVLAGTQGVFNHKKTDRLLDLCEQWQLPLVLFAEGGGGRPGDTDWLGAMGVAGLDVPSFRRYAALSGQVPRVGIVAGRCFAGNAALLGCSDVIIATRNTSVGMGGPAMIEGGGLGVVDADAVGPISMQAPNGVVDVVVEDEAAAVRVAKQYLSYLQGHTTDWNCADQRHLRQLIPENRSRVYEVREVIKTLADTGSVLELRRDFGVGAVTAFARIEGRAVGIMANNPCHLGGALDAPACDKLARFMQLCDAYDLPILSLCDTPGFMVGPESERTAMVRHSSRLFVTAAALEVPVFTIVLRKGYGLGAQGMAAGSFHSPMLSVAWPTGEFGAMGFEGAVKLGFRKELEAAKPEQRQALFDSLIAKAYEHGKALNIASHLEIDAVIDPAESRRWLLRGMQSAAKRERSSRRRFIDTW